MVMRIALKKLLLLFCSFSPFDWILPASAWSGGLARGASRFRRSYLPGGLGRKVDFALISSSLREVPADLLRDLFQSYLSARERPDFAQLLSMRRHLHSNQNREAFLSRQYHERHRRHQCWHSASASVNPEPWCSVLLSSWARTPFGQAIIQSEFCLQLDLYYLIFRHFSLTESLLLSPWFSFTVKNSPYQAV